ncbi:class I SAM-dependent methyltransferase [Tabrizicola aquatica]|uniref:class I SAM-dependent methyltransferase n=1 Tax=Tabrizicola aquatica TaxID=909926 RepID=UPI000CD09557|nr:class I SAM-dependent methyltransferase [Tabrizicola aquatica]
MGTAAEIEAEFAARPWAGVTEAEMAAGLAVPSMLRPEESRLYHWLGRRVTGNGAVVDLGAYAGGSAARLLSGLERTDWAGRLHAYDHFRSSRRFWEKFLPNDPLPDHDEADILPIARRHLARWADRVEWHRGEIAETRWTGGAVEILAVDAAKGAAVADHVAAEFFPALVPGRSVVVQQDYLIAVQPWLCAQMVHLRDCFLPLALVPKDCVVFLCLRRPTAGELQAARTFDLTDGQLMHGVRAAAKWHAYMIGRERFQAMLAQIKANPGARLGWQMRQAERARQG